MRVSLGVSLSLLALALSLAVLAPPTIARADDPTDRLTYEIASQIRCPVCQNESVADSQSQLAGQMRDLIRQKVAAGESEQQILAYFVNSYGQGILMDPPKAGFAGVVWLGALAIPILGLAMVARMVRRARGRQSSAEEASGSPDDGDLDPYEASLDRELELQREGKVAW